LAGILKIRLIVIQQNSRVFLAFEGPEHPAASGGIS
jgi:hypothetical protein